MDLQVEEFDKRNVELVPDKMVMMTDTELTQYFIQAWSLDFNDPGTRKYSFWHYLNTYFVSQVCHPMV